ncbi:hypothetical protein SC1_04020 [Sphingopyxis sp. C-1]|nr:hypothetical protein SC1_04020 [Sphingopyxis sp. C-1]
MARDGGLGVGSCRCPLWTSLGWIRDRVGAIFQSSGKFSPVRALICKSRSAGCARHVRSWSHPQAGRDRFLFTE